MTNHLLRLERTGRRLVTPELGRGEIDRYPEEAYRSHVEPLAHTIELDPFDEAVTELLATTCKWESAEIDPRGAPEIHQALPLTRREAADPGIWRYLAVIHRPDFIRHRWEFRSWATIHSRFWRPGTRPDSNTIGRLWWIAELTVVDGSYDLTRQVLAAQSLTNPIFVRTLSDYLPAVQAAADVLEGKKGHVVERVLLRLHRHLSIVPLEGLTREDLASLLDTWVEG